MTQIQEGEDDEDIPIIGTTTPTTQQGPITVSTSMTTKLSCKVVSYCPKLFSE
jgi:hypothetical protein